MLTLDAAARYLLRFIELLRYDTPATLAASH